MYKTHERSERKENKKIEGTKSTEEKKRTRNSIGKCKQTQTDSQPTNIVIIILAAICNLSLQMYKTIKMILESIENRSFPVN